MEDFTIKAGEIWVLIDVAIALLLGGMIGLEREWQSKPAGLRTNMIIAGASALFVSLGRVIMVDYTGLTPLDTMGIDPTRIMHAVIVGVGFIGAGTIIKSTDNNRVMFLTTAATIWMSAAVGICVGLKQYMLAVGVSLMMLIVNYVFRFVGGYISDRSNADADDEK
ncbi:MgtC/SapB family protein [Owenweeksia hongkongensis]|uniref:MgtC/SapB family protein n=1 Tax=Owenweeksia hongkongensis TaxID=253245 RepID=UPI003A947248